MTLGLDYNQAMVLAGTSLLGAASGTIGTFAVLRRRALLGDALSHATLPGVAAAFLLTGQRTLPTLLAGALVAAGFAIFVLAVLGRRTRLRDDASIAMVLGVFFGLGMVLFSVVQSQASGARAGLNLFLFGQAAGMMQRDVVFLGAFAAGTVAIVFVLFKEFALITFDRGFAEVQGWPGRTLDAMLLILLAGAVVLGLPSVGAVLMAAMLIIPSGAARFWTDSISVMTLLAAGFGVVSSSCGTLLSGSWGWPTGPTIILVASTIFIMSLIFAPRRGWLGRRRQQSVDHRRRVVQKLLIALAESNADAKPISASIARRAIGKGWIEQAGSGYRLTPEGLRKAEALSANRRHWIEAVERSPELTRSDAAFDLDVDPRELTS
ncbi:MAG: metal ABC transporter permease [Gemmataceae bacterium]|nr:metal ABC transporter permease [Gemmataceae bacterium]